MAQNDKVGLRMTLSIVTLSGSVTLSTIVTLSEAKGLDSSPAAQNDKVGLWVTK
jgi:hypothetical protein